MFQDESSVRYRARLGLSYDPSKYQAAIYDWVESGEGNVVVDAVAGAGKTSTSVDAIRLADVEALAVAFNREIAEVLVERLKGTRAKATTAHAHGLAALRFHCYARIGLNGKVEVDVDNKERKYPEMFETAAQVLAKRVEERGPKPEDGYIDTRPQVTLCGQPVSEEQLEAIADDGFPIAECVELTKLARLFLLDFDGNRYERGLDLLARRYDVDVDAILWPLVVLVVRNVLRRGCTPPRTGKWLVDFTDMIWLPNVLGLRPKQYDLVLVDECQDISTAARRLLIASVRRGGRMMWVGDPCQPSGTMVSTPSGDVPIESIKTGDMVVSCDLSSSAFIKNGKRVLGISSKPFAGELIRVESDGKVSKYTPNHRCVVRFSGLRKKWCVYVQRRGTQYRVGKSAMDYGSGVGSGPVARARCEGADALWILKICDSSGEATIAEQVLSGKYGVSQLRFSNASDARGLQQPALDQIWEEIGDNSQRALAMLDEFGQDGRYPLFDFTASGHRIAKGRNHAGQASLKRPIVARACNLIDGIEMLHYDGRSHYRASQWRPCMVTREEYKGPVYSMDVDKYELYVADGLLTHNCQSINGFAGADSDSFHAIIRETRAQVLPLSVCYRCPTSHLARAREWRSDIEARPGAPVGTIRRLERIDYVDEAKSGDLVICRRTAPLIGLCFELIAAGTSAMVRGRADMSKGLIKIIKRASKRVSKAEWKSEFIDGLAAQSAVEVEKIRARARDEQAAADAEDALGDRFECVRIIYRSSGAASAADLVAAVERIFADKTAAVTLSTVHRAKGLEADRVVILEFDRLMSTRATQKWQIEQEENLAYVAYTRAKSEIIEIPAPKRDREG